MCARAARSTVRAQSVGQPSGQRAAASRRAWRAGRSSRRPAPRRTRRSRRTARPRRRRPRRARPASATFVLRLCTTTAPARRTEATDAPPASSAASAQREAPARGADRRRSRERRAAGRSGGLEGERRAPAPGSAQSGSGWLRRRGGRSPTAGRRRAREPSLRRRRAVRANQASSGEGARIVESAAARRCSQACAARGRCVRASVGGGGTGASPTRLPRPRARRGVSGEPCEHRRIECRDPSPAAGERGVDEHARRAPRVPPARRMRRVRSCSRKPSPSAYAAQPSAGTGLLVDVKSQVGERESARTSRRPNAGILTCTQPRCARHAMTKCGQHRWRG